MTLSTNEESISMLLKALRFASLKHRDQRRKGSQKPPYINHPIEVCSILWEIGGVRDPIILAAALLHDTIEDTQTSPDEIREQFGDAVLSIVQELTDDKSLPKPERKRMQEVHAPHMSPQAKLIKLADKISNVNEIVQDPPTDWPLERRREYLDWSERVVTGLRGQNAALETRYDAVLIEGRNRLRKQN